MNNFWIIIILQSFGGLNYHIDTNSTIIHISLMLIRKLKMLNNSLKNENRLDKIEMQFIRHSLAAIILNIIRHTITTFILVS